MAIYLDQDAAYILYAEIARRALFDIEAATVSAKCRDEAKEFLSEYFPGWERRSKPRRRRPAQPRRKKDRIMTEPFRNAYFWLTSDHADAVAWRKATDHPSWNLMFDQVTKDADQAKFFAIPPNEILDPPTRKGSDGKYFAEPPELTIDEQRALTGKGLPV